MEAVQAGQGRFLVLVGEPGVGKTRLAQEVTLAARERGFRIATGRCYEPQESIAYFPFVEALGAAYDAAPPAVRAQLPSRWSDVARLLPDPEVALRAGLGQVVGGAEDQQRLFRQVTDFLAALAETQPLALLLDDLHWADSATIGLLQHLARHTRAARLLLVGTYRDVEVPLLHPLGKAIRDLGHEQLVERIDVRRLSPEGTAALVTAALGEGDVPAAVTSLVHGPTEGNPFFAHEVLRTLVDRGDIYRVEGHWERREALEAALPESVRGLIQDRVTRLAEATQETLAEASVLGQTFAFDDLLAMRTQASAGELTEEALESALEEAVASGVLREAGREEYTFSHALTQQALYTALSSRKKRRLHRTAALAIEHLPAQPRERRAGELAYHFLEAGDGERALPYALVAGDQAKTVYANDEAERSYRTALALARAHGDQAHEAEALDRVAQLYWWSTGRYGRAVELLEQTLAACEAADDVERQVRTRVRLARVYARSGNSEQGIERLKPLLASLDAPGDHAPTGELAPMRATVLVALADVCYHGGQYEQQLTAAERAATLAGESGQVTVLAEAENLRGIALGLLGRWDDAVQTLRQAVARAEMSADIFTCAHALRHLSDCYERTGQFAEAEAAIVRGLELADRLGHVTHRGIMAYKRGLHAFYLGEWIEMRAWYERSAAMFEEMKRDAKGSYISLVYTYAPFALGHYQLIAGDCEAGLRLLEEATALSQQNGNLHIVRRAQRELAEADLIGGDPRAARDRLDPLVSDPDGRGHTDVTPLLPLLAWADLEVGEAGAARALLDEAEERARLQHHQLAMLDVLRGRAMLAMREERWSEAAAALDHALASCRAMPYPSAEAKVLYAYGLLYATKREPEQAHERLQAALAICARLGEGLYRPHIERALKDVAAHLDKQ